MSAATIYDTSINHLMNKLGLCKNFNKSVIYANVFLCVCAFQTTLCCHWGGMHKSLHKLGLQALQPQIHD